MTAPDHASAPSPPLARRGASIHEPVDPGHGGEFDRFEAAPWSASMDDLSLVEAVDRLSESVVIGVSNDEVRRVARAATEGSMPASASRSL